MGLRNKQRKSLYEIGKNKYQFDTHEEMEIYKFLTCQRIKEKRIEELRRKELQFNYYKDWKEYIVDKCKAWDIDKLNEFRRHLIQRIRNIKPVSQYTSIVFPILLTELLSVIIWAVTELIGVDWSQASWIIALTGGIIFIAIMCFMCYLYWDVFGVLFKQSTEEYLLNDYKEIIEELIDKGKKDEGC